MPSADQFVIDSGPEAARWPMLIAAIDRLIRARSFDAIVETVRRSTRGILGADGVSVILAEGKQVRYVAEDAIGPLWVGRTFNAANCLAGWVMRHRSTALVRDIETDPRIPLELYRETFVKSMILAPVGLDAPSAAIGAYWAQPDAPTAEAVQMLEHLARACGAALANIALIDAKLHAEEWLSLALEASDAGAWRYEPDKNAFDASAAFKAMFGLKPDAPFGYFDMLQAIHPDDRAAAVNMRDRAVGSRGEYSGAFRCIRPDGAVRTLSIRAKVCRDAAGRPAALLGIAKDVTPDGG